jgi:hypothetical protein
MPYRLLRSLLARRWGITPPEVDEMDWREVAEEVIIMALIAEHGQGAGAG